MFGLNESATVYTPNGTTGEYTVVAKANLAVRLAVKPAPAGGAAERAEGTPRRLLLWDEAYAMPDNAQVDVGGQRWNVIAGSVDALAGLDSAVVYRRCEVMKVL